MELTRPQKVFLGILACWLLLSTSIVTLAMLRDPVHLAVLKMGWGLILFWIVGLGSVMYRLRRPICGFVRRIRSDWRIKFILFATLLAMVEEAITTAMTNLAPLFGVPIGKAYATASANYLDVIALHSVSLFVSFFVGWAWLLSMYRFSPFAVFVIFGITGTFAEMSFGPQHAMEFALWIYVYGLMIYLPACCVPEDRKARDPRWWHYPLAVFAPLLFLVLFPLAGLIHLFFPNHPNMHFPPIH